MKLSVIVPHVTTCQPIRVSKLCGFFGSIRPPQRWRSTFTEWVGRPVLEAEGAASFFSPLLRPPSLPSWPITTSGVLADSQSLLGSVVLLVRVLILIDGGRVSLHSSLSEMKLLDILSSLMMDDTYKGRGKYHSKVRRSSDLGSWLYSMIAGDDVTV